MTRTTRHDPEDTSAPEMHRIEVYEAFAKPFEDATFTQGACRFLKWKYETADDLNERILETATLPEILVVDLNGKLRSVGERGFCTWRWDTGSGRYEWVNDGRGGGMRVGKTDGTISARSGTTLGSGTVDLYTVGDDDIMVDASESLTVYNLAEAIADGKYVGFIDLLDNGKPIVILEDCT
jgi:hypothetical protein